MYRTEIKKKFFFVVEINISVCSNDTKGLFKNHYYDSEICQYPATSVKDDKGQIATFSSMNLHNKLAVFQVDLDVSCSPVVFIGRPKLVTEARVGLGWVSMISKADELRRVESNKVRLFLQKKQYSFNFWIFSLHLRLPERPPTSSAQSL